MYSDEGKRMISGVNLIPLKKIPDERGLVMHMLRNDDPHFIQFGEIYFSVIYPGIIKGWHLHKYITLNYAIIVGMVKLVLYDHRQESPTFQEFQEIYTGEDNYQLIQIPPNIFTGIKGIGIKPAIIANCATHPHDFNEIIRVNPLTNEIPYQWDNIHG
jgi:dTDP-4-dehydrorhamnose 3,5-epimerase